MTEMMEYISSGLKSFDMVFAIIERKGIMEKLTHNFCISAALQKTSKKILILSNEEIPFIKDFKHQFRKLNDKETDMIREIYFMYDFSDHFHVLMDSFQYGGLFNYVRAGDMTMEDIFQALIEP